MTDSQQSRLIIRHLGGSRFMVVYGANFTEPVELASPHSYKMSSGATLDLTEALRWYLEEFLDYPFSPETERAALVLDFLKDWGKTVFESLFSSGKGRDFFRDAKKPGLEKLQLTISSDDPVILAWPWEALFDPEAHYVAHTCRIDRKLDQAPELVELPELPKDRINILLITARPYGETDVGFRSISKPMVETIEDKGLPAHVRVLRPPTFDQLTEHLRELPNFYHIVHFDGHGSYRTVSRGPYTLEKGLQGHLVFEDADGRGDLKSAEILGSLLREYRIPTVVLNSCQSAMMDGRSEDAFASVATAFVRAGVRGVVAMSHSIYVSGVQQFIPAFYRRLFETGSLAEATRAGRQKMVSDQGRVCARGTFPLQDWLVPVLYQQEPFDFSFVKEAAVGPENQPVLPEEALDKGNPYGLIGRDRLILALERALRRAPAGVLIQGMAGVGKTTAVSGFLKWLLSTDGLEEKCFWFSFQTVKSAESVINHMVATLLESSAMLEPMKEKIEKLSKVLRQKQHIIVWDNFETVRGVEGSDEKALSIEDQQHLLTFLKQLRGGKSKVIITSRDPEDWLGAENRYSLQLTGLQGEERWEFCNAVLDGLGIHPDRDDRDFAELIDQLAGHPLLTRVLLSKMDQESPRSLKEMLARELSSLDRGDEIQTRLFAALRFVELSLAENLKTLLVPLCIFERFVRQNHLEAMAILRPELEIQQAEVQEFFVALTKAGLLQSWGLKVFQIHPALTAYLREDFGKLDAEFVQPWEKSFVVTTAFIAQKGFLSKSPYQRQHMLFYYRENFAKALALARELGLEREVRFLRTAMAIFARESGESEDAIRLLQEEELENEADDSVTGALHLNLGLCLREEGELDLATKHLEQAIDAFERLDDKPNLAQSLREMANAALSNDQLDSANDLLERALELSRQSGSEFQEAYCCASLGLVYLRTHALDQAEAMYLRALRIASELGDEWLLIRTYHQLGRVAGQKHQLDLAEYMFHEARKLKERHQDDSVSLTYHELGILCQYNKRLDEAEHWLKKSAAINERLGSKDVAGDYSELGNVASRRRAFGEAERWYRKAIEIDRTKGVRHTFLNMAVMLIQTGRIEEAAEHFEKSLQISLELEDFRTAGRAYANRGAMFAQSGEYPLAAKDSIEGLRLLHPIDPLGAKGAFRNLRLFFERCTDEQKREITQHWEAAGLGPWRQ